MITDWAKTPKDRNLVTKIAEISGGDNNYWAFRKEAQRGGVHGLIQYPAMMIPSMQTKLLALIREQHGDAKRVLDPFVGAGTMLTGAMEHGLDFVGFDINPLAILACKVKAGPYLVGDLEARTSTLLAAVRSDDSRSYDVSFVGQKKWFTKGASIGLSKIRRAIKNEDDLWVRRFYWLSMAETIRRISNSRISTYKLHIRPDDEIGATASVVVETFSNVVNENVTRILEQHAIFSKNEVLDDGQYRGKIRVSFQDVTQVESSKIDEQFDLLFTSPPYGDNATTIPYGQFSYLSLNWIPVEDIDSSIPAGFNSTTHAIDSASMGGSLRNSKDKAASLGISSAAFAKFYREIDDGENSSYAKRLSSFCFDLHRSVQSLSKLMAPGGYMVWTLGNRSLAGKRVPTDQIILDFLELHGMRRVTQFLRPIPSKRMPTRNNCAETMRNEIVLIAAS